MKLAWLRGSCLAARFSKKSIIKNETSGRAGDRICGTKFPVVNTVMQCTGQCLVDQLADGFDDPAPCCLAVVIVMRGELLSAVQH